MYVKTDRYRYQSINIYGDRCGLIQVDLDGDQTRHVRINKHIRRSDRLLWINVDWKRSSVLELTNSYSLLLSWYRGVQIKSDWYRDQSISIGDNRRGWIQIALGGATLRNVQIPHRKSSIYFCKYRGKQQKGEISNILHPNMCAEEYNQYSTTRGNNSFYWN